MYRHFTAKKKTQFKYNILQTYKNSSSRFGPKITYHNLKDYIVYKILLQASFK
jgi:hypothetical protein